jgi:hypothetical protein
MQPALLQPAGVVRRLGQAHRSSRLQHAANGRRMLVCRADASKARPWKQNNAKLVLEASAPTRCSRIASHVRADRRTKDCPAPPPALGARGE